MNIYEELNIKPVVNANATLTRLGGSLMPPEVVEAMVQASTCFVDLDELQLRVSARIAELTRNEAAYVSCGAAAGLVVATAACIAGTDPAAIDQLPDLTGLKDEVIVHRAHRNGYDHAVRTVGVKMVEIGNSTGTARWELAHAINPQTAAIFWFQGAMTGPGDLPLSEVIDVANEYGVPVIVDAAAQLPPTENLWRFTEMGAALAIFSGGKDLRGPQSTGLVLGRSDLIEGCRRNGAPNHSIGRSMKVGKEEMLGALAAVKRYLAIDQEARRLQDEETVIGWSVRLNRIAGVQAERSFPNEAGQPLPRVRVTFDVDEIGQTRDQVMEALLAGSPAISVAPAHADGIYLNPMTLEDGEDELVLAKLLAVLGDEHAGASPIGTG